MTPERIERDTVVAVAKQLCAASAGGVAGLLHPAVTLVVDNGGDDELGTSAAGRLACAEELTRIATRVPGRELSVAGLNGAWGIVVRAGGSVVAVIVASARDGLVDDLWAIVAPSRLAGWAAPSTAATKKPEV